MSQLGVESDIAELAIGHKRKRLYNFDEAWKLRCDAFAKVSEHVAQLLGRASAEGNPSRREPEIIDVRSGVRIKTIRAHYDDPGEIPADDRCFEGGGERGRADRKPAAD